MRTVRKRTTFSASLLLAAILCSPIATAKESTNTVFSKPTTVRSQTNDCAAKLEISPYGGYLLLTVLRHGDGNYYAYENQETISIEDVTGVALFKGDKFVVSVSPIYGKPGLYIVDCATQKKTMLVAPKTITHAYPDGADYFELHYVSGNSFLYYYAKNVDEMDFHSFRKKDNLRKYVLNEK